MITGFIHIRFLDILDIFLVAFLLYQLYRLLKGTAAMRIFAGIFVIYLTWLLVKAMKMELIGSIMGQVIGVGMIALIVVFQQEIRQFLLMIGNKYVRGGTFRLLRNSRFQSGYSSVNIDRITNAAIELSKTKTGALMVISRDASLKTFAETGEIINSDINTQLIKSVFYKDSPLHDGAILIADNKIIAAKCILPVSSAPDLPKEYGLRHRAGLGMTEVTDTIVIIVSEQSGNIAVARNGRVYAVSQVERLSKIITGFLSKTEGKKT
ncbi:MAG: diadenylate cyclase CdaA [Bacteroidales bacterium]|nr:diadenylate cyclase CdaA [Bacteroidales bacterium]MDD4215798.1 diadenylate cyclase CdaA [Bacteroidales bacterium]MDY0142186.1 diadenylate cyclase CdaA [Bacteroidales bacterium]